MGQERETVMRLTNDTQCTQGLVKGIESWDDNDCYYYAMEYCEGELFDFINRKHTESEYRQFAKAQESLNQEPMKHPTIWIKKVAKMFKQICIAVEWLHSKGYCHLDLSLENTMISNFESLKVKVIDLGLATKLDHKQFKYNRRVGKLQYMSPEVYECGNRQYYDARKADVYCLGVMLFMMLTGAPPYPAPQRSNSAFNYLINGRMFDVLKHWKRLRLVSEDALDLMIKIIKYEDERICMNDILNHPFLQNLEEENDEKKNDNDVQTNMNNDLNDDLKIPEVDQIQNKISGMSIDDNIDKKTVSDDEECSNRNKECVQLLRQWGLLSICDTLHDQGWSDPNEWNQLDAVFLRFQLGINENEASLFVQKCNEYSNAQKKEQKHYNQQQSHQQSQYQQQNQKEYQQQYHQQHQSPYYQQQHQYIQQQPNPYNQNPQYYQPQYQEPQIINNNLNANDYNNPYLDPNLVQHHQQQQQQQYNNNNNGNDNNQYYDNQNNQRYRPRRQPHQGSQQHFQNNHNNT